MSADRLEVEIHSPVTDLSASLSLGPDGIWTAKEQAEVSFPEDDHALLMSFEDRSFWFIHRNRCLLAVMKLFPPPGVFLDLGGGNGFVTRALEQEGIETVLLEPGPTGAANAKQRGISHVIRATFEQAGIKPGSLPAAGMFDVVEHINDDRGMMRKVYEALTPGGRVYLTVPAHQWLWSGHDAYAGHFRRYSFSELKNLVEIAGFKVLFGSYFFTVFALPQLLFRTLPHRLGLEKIDVENYSIEAHEPLPESLSMRLIQWAMDWELARLKKGVPLPVGASCLLVAEKV